MKVGHPGRAIVFGGLLILTTILSIGCSDRERSASPADGKGSGSTAIFEKGKTYEVALDGLPTLGRSMKITVAEVGPGPWLKIKDDDKGDHWISADHIIACSRIEGKGLPGAASQSAPARP